jgi:hypothetical protein
MEMLFPIRLVKEISLVYLVPNLFETDGSKEEGAIDDLAKYSSYNVLMTGDLENAIKYCSICKEKLNTVWLEDDEEWAFQNAIRDDDQVDFTVLTDLVLSRILFKAYISCKV